MDMAESTNSGITGLFRNLPLMAYRCINDPPNYTFAFVSEGCLTLTGYTSEELVGGKSVNFMDLVHPGDIDTLKNLRAATLSVGWPLETVFRIITKDGKERWLWERSLVVETDSEGMPHILEGFFTDITTYLRNETAELANRAKSAFLSKMSLDIRTPMNAIIGMAELGLREDMPDKVRDYTLTIRQAGTNLMSLLGDVLDYTKIESGDLEIIEEEYIFSSLVTDVIDTTKSQMAGTSLDLELDIDSKIPDALTGDLVRLRQIMLNLLSNAVKFTDEGCITFSVCGDVQGDTVTLTIKVEDTGRGVKESDLENLFKEFAQFDKKANRTAGGVGLGLSITRNLVKLMGGNIDVVSAYGVGSIFTVTLPQKVRSHEVMGDIGILGGSDHSDPYGLRGGTREKRAYVEFTAPSASVLIVDDISTNLRVAQGLLQPYKMHIDLCESGAKAIEAVTAGSYDLILMDHVMPFMDGIETTLSIRALDAGCETDCKNVPIVALTANAIYGTRDVFFKNGFNDFISKPIDTVRLNAVIEKWIPKEKQQKISEEGIPDENAAGKTHGPLVKISGVNVEKGVSMTGGEVGNYLQILKTYYENGREVLEELRDYMAKGDVEQVRIRAHALKGASGSVGADDIHVDAQALEVAATENDLAAMEAIAPEFFKDFETLLDEICPIIADIPPHESEFA